MFRTTLIILFGWNTEKSIFFIEFCDCNATSNFIEELLIIHWLRLMTKNVEKNEEKPIKKTFISADNMWIFYSLIVCYFYGSLPPAMWTSLSYYAQSIHSTFCLSTIKPDIHLSIRNNFSWPYSLSSWLHLGLGHIRHHLKNHCLRQDHDISSLFSPVCLILYIETIRESILAKDM